MYEKVKISVMFCCNDHRNGIFEEKISGINFGSETLSLMPYTHEPKFRVKKDFLFIAGKKFPYLDYREWYGNWCWDRAVLYGEDVIKLLNWLKTTGWFRPEAGECRIWSTWEHGVFKDKHIALFQKGDLGSL